MTLTFGDFSSHKSMLCFFFSGFYFSSILFASLFFFDIGERYLCFMIYVIFYRIVSM